MNELPAGWQSGTLGDLADTVMGYAFKSTDFVLSGTPLLRMGNLYQNQLDLDRSPVFLPDSFKTQYSKFLVKEGDLVMSMTGTMGKRDYGFTVQIPDGASDSLLNQRVIKFIAKKDADPVFLLNLLRSELTLCALYSFPGGTKQANLSAKQILNLPALIPPTAEQTKIAQILSTWDKAIATTERLLANSQQQKLALMQQLLTGQKRFAGFNGDWENDTLINLGDTFTGLKGKTKDDFGAGQPYIPYINIFKNSAIDTSAFELVKISPSENQSKVQLGDIFFTTSSETPEEVGMSSILLEQVGTVYLNSFCFGFRLFNFDRLTPEYARYLLRSEFIRKSISELAQGATRYNLSKKQLMQLELLLPPLPEQQKIAQVLSTADAEITNLQAQLATLKLEKKALMQQLLTGQRRVKPDADAAA